MYSVNDKSDKIHFIENRKHKTNRQYSMERIISYMLQDLATVPVRSLIAMA